MHILIIGGAGMVGRKLARAAGKDGALGGKAIAKATLHDVIEPAAPAGAPFAASTIASRLLAAGRGRQAASPAGPT